MSNRKLRKTIFLFKEVSRLLKDVKAFLVTKTGYDFIPFEEKSNADIEALINELVEQKESIEKDSSAWINELDAAIKNLENYISK